MRLTLFLKNFSHSKGLEGENKELYLPMSNQFINHAYLLMGGNTGDRLENLNRASKAIERQCGPILKRSSFYETAAWGMEGEPDFINQLLLIKTDLDPEKLLSTLLNIESEMGRKRQKRYASRDIDIDILYYNDIVYQSTALTIPHPRISQRKFALVPLAEIAPDLVDPVSAKDMTILLNCCNDPLEVNLFSTDV
jgi:2-amino-4-hydroxy-6-hydroxymethyldihydropteridine diphosphokinase